MKIIKSPPTSLKSKLKVIFFAYLLMLIWMIGIHYFINWMNPPTLSSDESLSDSFTPIPILYQIFFGCIFAPLWEELIYRHSAALVVKALKNDDLMLPVILISSAIFGWGHGFGPESLLRQGVGGLIFFYVYLKNGRSYWSSVLLHAMWNTGLMVFYH